MIPGNVLADVYNRYGSRLLEGNVRSFLSTKSKVNSGIQATIRSAPEMFFAYNNGIAATAETIVLDRRESELRIISATDLQIVNGGQQPQHWPHRSVKTMRTSRQYPFR